MIGDRKITAFLPVLQNSPAIPACPLLLPLKVRYDGVTRSQASTGAEKPRSPLPEPPEIRQERRPLR